MLGGAELGFLFSDRLSWIQSANVMAQWLAENGDEDFDRVVRTENERTGCDGIPAVSYPDGQRPGKRVWVDLPCTHRAVVYRALTIGLVVRGEAKEPFQPTPSPSSSPSPVASGATETDTP